MRRREQEEEAGRRSAGVTASLMNILIMSATAWRRPKGPTRLGPGPVLDERRAAALEPGQRDDEDREGSAPGRATRRMTISQSSRRHSVPAQAKSPFFSSAPPSSSFAVDAAVALDLARRSARAGPRASSCGRRTRAATASMQEELPVRADGRLRQEGPLELLDASLDVGERAFLLGERRGGQDDVGGARQGVAGARGDARGSGPCAGRRPSRRRRRARRSRRPRRR